MQQHGNIVPSFALIPFRQWKSVVIIVAAVVCVYAQTLRFGFVNYDDDELVYHNTAFLSQWSSIGTAFTSHAFIGAGGESVYYRPLLMISYIVDYHLWNLNPSGYHWTNVVLHALTSIGVFLLALLIVAEELPALVAALIFTLHPIQTESVAWIAGRNDVLLGFFVVLMVLLYGLSKNYPSASNRFLLFSSVSFGLALFTKESAALYLLLLPLIDILVDGLTLRKVMSIKSLKKFWLMIGILLLYLVVRFLVFGEVVGAERLYGHRSMVERIANVPAIIAEHFKLLIMPVNLSVAHPLTEIIWFRSPWNIVAIMSAVAFVAFIWFSWKRDKIIGIGLLWIAIGLMPVLGIVPVPIPILEHRLYVPMVGFAIVISQTILIIGNRFSRPALMKSIAFTLSIVLATASVVRLPVWKNGVTLFSDAVEKAPTYTPSYFSLAGAFYESKRTDEAVTTMERYIGFEPNDLRGYLFLRDLYYSVQRYRNVAEISKHIIRIDNERLQRYLEAGTMYEELRLPDSAAVIYREGIARHPASDDLHFRLGIVLQQMGRIYDAEAEFRSVLQFNPSSIETYVVLGKLYNNIGKQRDAISILEAGLQTEQPSRDLIDLLHFLYVQNGEKKKAEILSHRFP